VANWRRTIVGGLVATLVALFLLVGTSAGHAMPVRCDDQRTVIEAPMHHQHSSKSGQDHRDTACCTVTCAMCLTVLTEIGISTSTTSDQSTPILSVVTDMTGRVPSPDLGPPRKSV